MKEKKKYTYRHTKITDFCEHLIPVLFGERGSHSLVLRVNEMITILFKCSVKVFKEILELLLIYFNPILSSAKYRSFINQHAVFVNKSLFHCMSN